MLGEINAHTVLAVSDLGRAKEFYEQKLGLEETGEHEQEALYRVGNGHILLYESDKAGSNRATAMCWETNDPAAVVEWLIGRGVKFEHYPDLPGVTLEGELHRMGPMIAAWFKDPDGNILCIGNAL